jgi:predicted  nucleic acid-binding Zn-ribbon protein
MAAKTRNGNGNLEAAMALLLNNQAALVAQHTSFLSEMAEIRKEFAEARKEFAEIRKDLDTIKAVLIRHETMLEKLPEAIRDKIGFKQ